MFFSIIKYFQELFPPIYPFAKGLAPLLHRFSMVLNRNSAWINQTTIQKILNWWVHGIRRFISSTYSVTSHSISKLYVTQFTYIIILCWYYSLHRLFTCRVFHNRYLHINIPKHNINRTRYLGAACFQIGSKITKPKVYQRYSPD